MKTTIFNKKALAFFGAAAILLAAVFTTGCKTDAGSGDPAPETFTVAFSVDGANGTLKAKADGIAETDKSPIVVQKGKTVTFTATPDSGYRVKGWTLDGTAVNGTNNSYTFNVTKAVNVQVNFESNSTPLSKYTVTFSVGDGNGKLKAKADGVAETAASPISVEKGKTVTFTATPKSGYKVDKWTITGGAFETGTGMEESLTAKVKITANTKVSVSFKSETITPPSPTEFTVEMTHGEHGTVTASPVIPAGGKVAKDTEITFTADPASGYKVEKWTITGGAFEAGTGTEGSTTAKVKITAKTKVSVSFKTAMYTEVPFGTHGADLDTYLKDTASSADINYIKVTGLTAADLKGDRNSWKPSPLGKILRDNPTKKVALKLGEISGLTDMRYCFLGCTSLTQAPVIPSTVTNMESCFYYCTSLTQAPEIPSGVANMGSCFNGCANLKQAPEIPSNVTDMTYCFYECKSLTQAPVIPSSVTNMRCCFYNCTSLTQAPVIPSNVTNMESCFSDCENITAVTLKCNYVHGSFNYAFSHCSSLSAGSIKVPAGQVQTYKDNAGIMGTTADRFVAE